MFTFLASLFKSLPILIKLFEIWERHQQGQIVKHYEKKRKVTAQIVKQLKDSKSDEDRAKALRDYFTLHGRVFDDQEH